ncbi:2'-5' RNA ligase family protein [Nonomuraea sp. NPDC050556]|uniref:2'-5' RNA ligase family protein n=1 Tax=Nonomuraea sp. NPDC050556 TaxID=3364369 RepID=UPI0037AB9FEC
MANRWELRRSLMLPPGQGLLYWHVLLGDEPDAVAIVQEAQARLGGLSGLDLVPLTHIHLTVLVAGYSHEITSAQVDEMAREAGRELAEAEPISVTLGRVLYHPEAIILAAQPAERLAPLLEAARTATRAVTGQEGRLAHDSWTPHVTVAYSSANGPAAPIINALGKRLPDREVTVHSLSLVAQDGPETTWEWQPLAEVRLDSA